MKIVTLTFLFAALVLTGGCVSNISKAMDSWVGSHKGDLIAQHGPPNQVASDGRGGEILIYGSYVDLGQIPGKATTDYRGNITYTAPQQRGYQRTRMFYVNPEGIVYFWRWKGL